MNPLETALHEACEDQRDALRDFRRTGSAADAARVHYEACPSCERALDLIAELRAGTPEVLAVAAVEGNRPAAIAAFAAVSVIIVGVFGLLFYGAFVRPFLRAAPSSEAARVESRIEFARMPGRPDICVASLRGVGGYGPTFLGASPCAEVRARVVSDEGFAWRLREYEVVRIEGTDACLAYHGPESFTLPCRTGD